MQSTLDLGSATGDNLIEGASVPGTGTAVSSHDPATGRDGDVAFRDADPRQIDQAMRAALDAFPTVASDRDRRARTLARAADLLDAHADDLVPVADRESGLGRARLNGELARATGQLRRFAEVARDGRYLDAVIDTARPDATPPRPDVRLLRHAIGPVAVFGASNFPFAFSVPGGDTASALAAGCPVVLKAHPAHPATSELTARLLIAAAADVGLPAGTVALVHGVDRSVGKTLVEHPALRAVAVTGSTPGGRALFDIASARPEPIPVYAEMGSTNPVFVTRGAIASNGATIATQLAGSMLQSMGQFCTKPGVIVVPTGEDGDVFVEDLRAAVEVIDPHPLLTPGIADAFARGAGSVRTIDGVDVLVDGGRGQTGAAHEAVLVSTDADRFHADPQLREECFGPFGIVVRASDEGFTQVAAALDGMLVATLHVDAAELEDVTELWTILRERAGRLVVGGVPTGVAVTTAMHHGGPYPATTAPAFTSVGDRAIGRFVRPVSYQSTPQALLPAELHDANPLGLLRTVDGRTTTDPVG